MKYRGLGLGIAVLLGLLACNQKMSEPLDVDTPITMTAIQTTEAAKLLASDGAASDGFGYSVAMEGDTAVIGSWRDDDRGTNSGSAYVYRKVAGSWSQEAKLLASDGTSADNFGSAVAIVGDTIFVSAPQNFLNANVNSGAVYVFTRAGSNWTEQTILAPSTSYRWKAFGASLAIDDTTLIVGANQTVTGTSGLASGTAYIFENSSGSWTQEAELLASNTSGISGIGQAVAIDGDTAVVGANGTYGAALVFSKQAGGWLQEAELMASDQTAGDAFGDALSLSGDTLIVGARHHDDLGISSGSAYIFERSVSSWAERVKLLAVDGAQNDQFGFSVVAKGNSMFIGGLNADTLVSGSSQSTGAVYSYEKNGQDWLFASKLSPLDIANADQFGYSLALSQNAIIASSYQDDDNGVSSGSAYIFDLLVDNSAPIITAQVTGILGNNDWYKSDLELSWLVTDLESSLTIISGCQAQALNVDTDISLSPNGETFSCEASSLGGAASEQISLKKDSTPPTVSILGFNDGDSFELDNEPVVSCSTTDVTSGVATQATLTVVPDSTNPGDGSGIFHVFCEGGEDNAGNTVSTTATYQVMPPADTTPPVISSSVSGTLGANEWYISDVTLSWGVADDESAVSTSGCESVSVLTETPGTTFTCQASSAGGFSSDSVLIKLDKTPPVVSLIGVTNGASYTAAPSPSCQTADVLSGVAAEAVLSVVVGSTGVITASCSDAVDLASNTASTLTATYTVTDSFEFSGFFKPIENPPAINKNKAGSNIPIKFKLAGKPSPDVITSVVSTQISCVDFSLIGPSQPITNKLEVEDDGRYKIEWKTNKAWKKTCRELQLSLADGSEHRAYFEFK